MTSLANSGGSRRNLPPPPLAQIPRALHHICMPNSSTHRRSRWLVPAGAAILIAGSSATFAVAASADSPTPSAQELLTAVQDPAVQSLSGTVVTIGDLGLPAVPAGIADVGPFTLNDDEVRAQVWVDGEDRQRVSIGDAATELSAIRNGDTAWLWSANDSRAVQLTGNPDAKREMDVPGTPAEIASELLGDIDPTTEVSVGSGTRVADRPVYELVLTPKDEQTLVERIVVAVDTATSVPLQVQVYSTQITEPAFQSGFTTVDFSTPAADTFEFTPPAGADVTTRAVEPRSDKPDLDAEVVGEGWSSIVTGSFDMSKVASELAQTGQSTTDPDVRSAATEALVTFMSLPTVSGDWGSGKVVAGTLFSIIITDDGEYVAGAVSPETLVEVLATR